MEKEKQIALLVEKIKHVESCIIGMEKSCDKKKRILDELERKLDTADRTVYALRCDLMALEPTHPLVD